MPEQVLISAIEHYSYCPRQCGLIHVECIFDENLLTLRGSRAHERVHEETVRAERGKTVLRGLPLWSETFGLVGKADAVEVETRAGAKQYMPIEYKVGRDTGHRHALYQVAAQAICLEEMFATEVVELGLYFVATKQRKTAPFDRETRLTTLEIVESIRAMQAGAEVPEPVADKRCRRCSLIDACMPFAVRAAERPRDLYVPLPEAELP